MAYQLRVILDTKEDIFKDILIDENKTLLDLHVFLKSAFKLPGNELASFYTADDNWLQDEEEITLENFSDENDILVMKDFKLKQILTSEKNKLIYVYDLMLLWTFFVELTKIDNKNSKVETKVILSFGEVPNNAPEKQINLIESNNSTNRNFDLDSGDDLYDDDDDIFDEDDLEGLSTYDSDEYY